MRDITVFDVSIDGNEVVVSLVGGTDNVCGSIRFYQRDATLRNRMADDVRSLINRNVLVDIAFSLAGGRWRLLGKDRTVIGGLEPTKLDINQTRRPEPPKRPDWGLGWPSSWGEEE